MIAVEIGAYTMGWAKVNEAGVAEVTNGVWEAGTFDVVVTEYRAGKPQASFRRTITIR
jgi:hypothetical protein